MSEEYYGPTVKAQETLNRLLSLPARGDEQDWEIELTDATKLPAMFELAENASLNIEERSALILLIVWTIDELIDEGGDGADALFRVRRLLGADSSVSARLRFYCERIGTTPTVERMLA